MNGFTPDKAQSILTANIKAATYIGMSTASSGKDGSGFTEPAASTGYSRCRFGEQNLTISAQIANKDIIFLFEALEDCGTFVEIGCFDAATGGTPFFGGPLDAEVEVPAGYVPLIRANKFVIGLDKEALEAYA